MVRAHSYAGKNLIKKSNKLKNNKMKVIITGSTGMIGKAALLECLDHQDINEVLSISRKSLEMHHSKLKELIHADFRSLRA